jgi:hypothetical protein
MITLRDYKLLIMPYFKKTLLFICIVLSISVDSKSQKSSSDTAPKKSYFKADLNYLSDLIYLGRKDSVAYPYITSTIGYYHTSGFYLSGAISYLAAANTSQIDLFTIDAGYEFDINNVFSGTVYGEKYFYNSSSNALKSDFKGILDAALYANLNLVQLSVEGGVTFATKKDFTTSFAATHLFEIEKKGHKFSMNPSFTFNFSTLKFYEGNSNKTFTKKQQANNPNVLTVSATTTASKQGFCLMGTELSVPLTYEFKGWSFYLTPYYCIPKNQISTSTSAVITLRNGSVINQQFDSTPWSERNLKNQFYLEAGLTFSF